MTDDKKIELLTKCGEAAYGKHWKTELANYLDTNPRSVRQWANGERTIPDSVMRGMLSHLYHRIFIIERTAQRVAVDLRRYIPNYRRIIYLGENVYEMKRADWFDVEGRMIGLTKDDQIIDIHDYPVLTAITPDEFREAKKRDIAEEPGYD